MKFKIENKEILIIDEQNHIYEIMNVTDNIVNGFTITIKKPKPKKISSSERIANALEELVELKKTTK